MRRAEGVTIRHARKFIFQRLDTIRDARRHIIMWVLAVGILIGASGLQLMWYHGNYQTLAPADGGTFAEGVLGPVETLNPLFSNSPAEESISSLMFSRLFMYDTSGNLHGDLASDIKVDTTGKIYTVTLRPDVKWTDGYSLTAKDILFTTELLKNTAVHPTIKGWDNITVAVIDERTLTFTLPAIYAAFIDALTFPIVPQHILAEVTPNTLRENTFSDNPIGSGPFKLRFIQDIDRTVGRRIIHLERNSDYYNGMSHLDRFQLHVYGTRDAILKALSSGEISAAADLTMKDTRLINNDNYQVVTSPVNSGVFALLNTTKGVLKDKNVRLALQTGTDTGVLRKQLASDIPALDSPFIDGQLTGNVPHAPAYDLDKAKKILDDAGWKISGETRQKDGIPLKINVVTTKDNDYERALETLAGQWRSIGVTVETLVINPSDQSQGLIQNVLQQRNYDVLIYQLSIGADPDVYAYWHSSQIGTSGLNFSNYANAISDDALVSARSRNEIELRNNKYLTFARQWLADVPAIGLYQSTSQYVHSKSVQPYSSSNTLISSQDRYADILNWSVGSETVFKTP